MTGFLYHLGADIIMLNRNRIAYYFAWLSGLMLIVAGVTGVSQLTSYEDFASGILGSQVVQYIFSVPLLIASFGGAAVIIGGMLILRNHVRTGRFVIFCGSGISIISLGLDVLRAYRADELAFTWFLSVGTLGACFAVLAMMVSKPLLRR